MYGCMYIMYLCIYWSTMTFIWSKEVGLRSKLLLKTMTSSSYWHLNRYSSTRNRIFLFSLFYFFFFFFYFFFFLFFLRFWTNLLINYLVFIVVINLKLYLLRHLSSHLWCINYKQRGGLVTILLFLPFPRLLPSS